MSEKPSLHRVLSRFEHQAPNDTRSWLESTHSSKELTRKTFFDETYWAILVANMKASTARSWDENARKSKFPFNWRKLGDWSDDDFNGWCRRMAKTLSDPKADLEGVFRERWYGIWDIGWRLAQFESEAEFREHYFAGKEHGSELTDDDVCRLKEIKRKEGALYRIGPVSIYFILRNLGGDFLKPDTWIKAFAAWYGCDSVEELVSALRSDGIHCGKFDAYCWEYCTAHVGRASDLPRHFNDLNWQQIPGGINQAVDVVAKSSLAWPESESRHIALCSRARR